MMPSDVRRVHREYSWSPQLLEARRAGRRRLGMTLYVLDLDRSVRRVQGRGHIMAAARLQLVKSRMVRFDNSAVKPLLIYEKIRNVSEAHCSSCREPTNYIGCCI